jgi:Na+-transporting NADH:ubiquinone oxidoreductase subunit NqrB
MRRPLDPRAFQIASLSGLLVYGIGWRGFDVDPPRVALLLGSCLLTQWACTAALRFTHARPLGLARPPSSTTSSERTIHARVFAPPGFEARSALISGLSLCLLLRTGSAGLAVLAAVITIASKFVLRAGGKHVFNPTNFGLVATMALTGSVWVSPGQWGSTAFFAFLVACAGLLVVNRAARSDVTCAFLLFWSAALFGRATFLGDPLAIPLHQLQSGALLLFAFFMISDPKTTPDSRPGRVLFAALVAAFAYYVQFRLFRPNALLWSLAAAAPLVPILDRLLPGPRYDWGAPRPEQRRSHATSLVEPARLPAAPASA